VTSVTCDRCHGKGFMVGFGCSAHESGEGCKCGVTTMPCGVCDGTGKMDAAIIDRRIVGRKLREVRREPYKSLRDFSIEHGIDVVSLSRMENGLEPIPGRLLALIPKEPNK